MLRLAQQTIKQSSSERSRLSLPAAATIKMPASRMVDVKIFSGTEAADAATAGKFPPKLMLTTRGRVVGKLVKAATWNIADQASYWPCTKIRCATGPATPATPKPLSGKPNAVNEVPVPCQGQAEPPVQFAGFMTFQPPRLTVLGRSTFCWKPPSRMATGTLLPNLPAKDNAAQALVTPMSCGPPSRM